MIARGRNFIQLAQANVLSGADDHVVYDDEFHRYTVDGTVVPISVTSVIKKVLDEKEFDAGLIIRKNLAAWRRNPRSKYGTMVAGHDDEQATEKIKKKWLDANRLGTQLHRRLEGLLNGEEMSDDGETDVEWPGVLGAVEELRSIGALPFRTELSVFWKRSDGVVVCAGQIDVLMKCGDGDSVEFVMIDLKRTDKPLSANERPFDDKMCLAPLDNKFANEFHKYSLQMSMYAIMLKQCTGIDVFPENRFLMKAHPLIEKTDMVACACFDSEAREILDSL